MTGDLIKELGRKTFHMLSLAYLAAYHVLGYPRVIQWMVPWTVVVLVVETVRLKWAPLNDFLFRVMGGLAREEEKENYSGIVHTTLGAFILFLMFKERTAYVSAGLYCVALGDAAAALVWKSIGRHHIFNSKKSIEGSAACLLVCAAAGVWEGFSAGSAIAGALAATVIEFLPTNVIFNDNMWMPIGVAITLRLCAA